MTHMLIQADARRIPLADRSVHCVVTSPPYWALRNYGVEGQLGLERTPDEYVAKLVAMFREVHRVLRNDGTLWLNLGDTFSQGKKGASHGRDEKRRARRFGVRPNENGGASLPAGNLVGIPWRVALAMQADGWILRSEIIWHKPSPMPGSQKTRPTCAHEQVFLFAKRPGYFYDWFSVLEKTATSTRRDKRIGTIRAGDFVAAARNYGNGTTASRTMARSVVGNSEQRNLRTVWRLSSESYRGAHFATFPRKLVEPCIKAGTSERGACPTCGAPWERVTNGVKYEPEIVVAGERFVDTSRGDKVRKLNGKSPEWVKAATSRSTLGWRPTCTCPAAEPVPCVVFDPFNGTGTTGVVALALKRHYIGCDLSADYLAQAGRRIERPHQPVTKQREQAHPLFAHMEDA